MGEHNRAVPWAGAYLKTAAMSAGTVGESPLFLLDYALRLLRVIVLLSLWRAILGDSSAAGAMSLGTVLTYTLISEVFAYQLEARTTISTCSSTTTSPSSAAASDAVSSTTCWCSHSRYGWCC